MLSELPHDETGYLYEFDKADYLETGCPLLFNIQVFPDALKLDEGKTIGTFIYAIAEAQLDQYIEAAKQIIEANGADLGVKVFQWSYADGSPRVSDAVADTQPVSNVTGNAEYTIMVTDADGYAVPGAMVQICDDATCRLETTDAEGTVRLEMKPYPYEIHILMAHAGYKASASLYTLPKDGGSLTITLEKE